MMSRIFYAVVWTYIASIVLSMVALHSAGMEVDANIFLAAPYALIAGFPVAAGIIFAIAFVSVNAYIEAQQKRTRKHTQMQAVARLRDELSAARAAHDWEAFDAIANQLEAFGVRAHIRF